MDEANDLAGCPYAVLRVAIQENLAAPLPAHVGSDLGEFARRALLLDLESLLGHLVAVQASGVAPAPEQESRVSLVRLDDLLLDLDVDRSLDGAQEAGTHVDTARAETQSCGEPLPIGEAARGNEGNLERLPRPAEQDEVCDVRLSDVASRILLALLDQIEL